MSLLRAPSLRRALRVTNVMVCVVSLCVLAAVANSQQLPDQEIPDSQPAPDIGSPPTDQTDQLDQQLEQAEEQENTQQDVVDQQLDQAEDQYNRQQDQVDQQLDQAEEQLDRRQDELNQQLEQDEEQLNGRLPAAEADSEATVEGQATTEQRVRLGVAIDENAATNDGITIGDVLRGSAAASAGLRSGDVILSIDGEEVLTADQLDGLVRQRAVGDAAEFMILRNGQRQPMTITFQEFRNDQFGRGQYDRLDRPAIPNRGQHGWLGITLKRDDLYQSQQGAVVETVYPAGPAARAGIERGDRIVEFQGEAITSVDHLLENLSQTRPGDRIELVVFSDGNSQTVTTTLEDVSVFNVGTEIGFDPQYSGRDPSGFVSQTAGHDMMVEQHRRMAEQHERIENALNEIRGELEAIRQELQMHRNQTTSGARQTGENQEYTQPGEQPGLTPPRGDQPGQDALPPVEVRQQPTDNPPNPQ